MGRRFIPCEAPAMDPLPRVRSGAHRGVNDGTPLSHAWDGTGNRLEMTTGHQTEHHPQVYDVSFPRSKKRRPCPFPSCLGSSRVWNGSRSHFNSQNWEGITRIPEENLNPLPRCKHCGRQVPAGRLNTTHYSYEKCN